MKKVFFYVNSGPTALAIIESQHIGSVLEFIFESQKNYFRIKATVSSYIREDGSATSFKEISLKVESSENPELVKGDFMRGKNYNSVINTGTFSKI